MGQQTRVVVYSKTLNVAGIATSLKADAGLGVISVDPRSASIRKCISETDPAAITFDLNDVDSGLDISLLLEQSGLLLIGVDASSDALLVLSSQSQQALSVADLVNVIRQKVSTSELPASQKFEKDVASGIVVDDNNQIEQEAG